MRKFKLRDMTKGWYVGNFKPTVFGTDACELAHKHYEMGDYDAAHYHMVATEITVISEGVVEMNGEMHGPGDIIVIDPMEVTDFRALTTASTIVLKVPCIQGDKYDSDSPQG